MKATEAKLLSFLQKSPQFVIPIYQRTYSWTDKQCRQLWDDILRAGASDTISVHFIGSIVYVEQANALLLLYGDKREDDAAAAYAKAAKLKPIDAMQALDIAFAKDQLG